MSSLPLSATADLADRFALILGGLRRAVAARMAADRALAPLLMLLWSRLHRTADRFARLVDQVAAARAPKLDARQNRPARPSGAHRLPSRLAWLIRLVPEAAAYAGQLQALLATPEMAALLDAAPRSGRLLRPICRMLAVPPGPAALAPTIHSRVTAAPPAPPIAPSVDARASVASLDPFLPHAHFAFPTG